MIGQPLRLDQGVYTVIGVLPRAAQLLRAGGKAQLWLPGTEQPPFDRGFHFMRVLGRLRDDVTPAQAAARAQLMSKRIQGAGLTDHSVRLESARDVLVGDSRRILLVLLAAVGFVLLIVCANLANLFLTKSVERGREFAVRIALGAGRIRVLRQLLTESVLIAVLGGVAGLALAHVLIGVTRAVADKAGGLAPASSADPRVALFTLLVSATVGALFGLWPALRAARFDLAGILRESDGRSVGGRSAWRRRRVLVGFEIALSVVLLTGAGLLVRSLLSTLSESPGFDEHDVVAFGVSARGKRYEDDAGQAGYAQDLLSRVVQIRGVTAVGAVSHLPLDGGDTSGPLDIVGRDFPEGTAPEIKKRIATPGYFAALGIPLLRGRDFSAADRMGSRDVVIITESLARRFWPGRDPIGQRVRFGWGPGAEEQEIVGVVGDILHDGLDQPSQGMLYRPFAQFPQSGFTLVVKAPGDPAALVRAVRAAVHALDASVPLYQVRTMSSVIRESVAPRRSLMQMLVGFAALALVLAAVGVYAVTAQSVSQRTREIGVRLAIGATRNEILRMVLTAEAKVIAVSVVIGLTVAGAATGMLSSVLYGVSATDVTTFGAAAVLLSVVALAASCIPAIRAARLDPSSALRAD
jgi:putative ABC transport system permease protein